MKAFIKPVKLCHKIVTRKHCYHSHVLGPSTYTDLVTISNMRQLQHSLDTQWNRNVQTTTVEQRWEGCDWDSPLFNFGLSVITASHSFSSWITTLRLSLKGDLGLFGLRTLWKNGCTFPKDSWKIKFYFLLLY